MLAPPAGDRPQSLFSSELISQRELHFARCRCLLKFPERQRRRKRQAGIGEIHIVEHVKCFGSETNYLSFLRQLERLLQCQVSVEVRRKADNRLRSTVSGQFVSE